jgi:hypothetical protein
MKQPKVAGVDACTTYLLDIYHTASGEDLTQVAGAQACFWGLFVTIVITS